MKKEEIWIALGTLVLTLLLIWTFSDRSPRLKPANPLSYEVVHQWKLPEELAEISGISWLPGNRLAAVQDEYGIILIFGLEKGRILEKIPFAEQGDYEALAVKGKDAYALKDVYSFNEEFFPQPEGIAFSPDGSLFISNEGEKDIPATITRLKLN